MPDTVFFSLPTGKTQKRKKSNIKKFAQIAAKVLKFQLKKSATNEM